MEKLWSDGHTHLGQNPAAADYLKVHRIRATVNSQNPGEWRWNHAELAGESEVAFSYGVHPWDSERGVTEADQACLVQAAIVGEIGLDNEWTQVPLAVQEPVFYAQLTYAASAHKPVILHTKGAEEQILHAIRRYPNRYYVHWYDCADFIADYIDLGCYLSIGPDIFTAPNVKTLARMVPDERMLLETDGIQGVTWANPTWASEVTVWGRALDAVAEEVATLRGVTRQTVQGLAKRNLTAFWNESN